MTPETVGQWMLLVGCAVALGSIGRAAAFGKLRESLQGFKHWHNPLSLLGYLLSSVSTLAFLAGTLIYGSPSIMERIIVGGFCAMVAQVVDPLFRYAEVAVHWHTKEKEQEYEWTAKQFRRRVEQEDRPPRRPGLGAEREGRPEAPGEASDEG